MTLVLSPTATGFEGSVVIADQKGKVLVEGTISGEFSGNALTGAIRAADKKCTTFVTLTASHNGGVLTGGYHGRSSCSKKPIDGIVTLYHP